MVYLLARLGLVGLGCGGLLSCTSTPTASTPTASTPIASTPTAKVPDRPASPSPIVLATPSPTGAGCRTYIQDKTPPTNVRSSPEVKSGNLIGTLKNGTTVTVMGQQNLWLQLKTPLRGWVAVSTTAVSCVPPGGRTSDAFKIIPEWGDRAIQGDRLAADLLARYSLQADGAIAESLSGVLAKWAQKTPQFLTAVLDGQPDQIRRRALDLLDFGFDPQSRSQFTGWVAKLPAGSLTRQGWEARSR